MYALEIGEAMGTVLSRICVIRILNSCFSALGVADSGVQSTEETMVLFLGLRL